MQELFHSKLRPFVRIVALATAIAMIPDPSIASYGLESHYYSELEKEKKLFRPDEQARQRYLQRMQTFKSIGVSPEQIRSLQDTKFRQHHLDREMQKNLDDIRRARSAMEKEAQEGKVRIEDLSKYYSSLFPTGQVIKKAWEVLSALGEKIKGVEITKTNARGQLISRTGTPEVAPPATDGAPGVLTAITDSFYTYSKEKGEEGVLIGSETYTTSVDDLGKPMGTTTVTHYRVDKVYTKADEALDPSKIAGSVEGYTLSVVKLSNVPDPKTGISALAAYKALPTLEEKNSFMAAKVAAGEATQVKRTETHYYTKADAIELGIEGLEGRERSYKEKINSPGVEASRDVDVQEINYRLVPFKVPEDADESVQEALKGQLINGTHILQEISRTYISTFLGVPTLVTVVNTAFDLYNRVTADRVTTQRGAETRDETNEYTFNNKNLLETQKTIGAIVNGEGAGSLYEYFTRFVYDLFDRVIGEEGYRIENGVRSDFSLENLAFDRFDRVIEYVEEATRFGLTTIRHVFDIAFDKNGLLTHRVMEETSKQNNLKITTVEDNEYNENGLIDFLQRVITTIGDYFGADGVGVTINTTETQTQRFRYDDLFRVVWSLIEIWDALGAYTRIERVITAFDDLSRVFAFVETTLRRFTMTFEEPVLDREGNPMIGEDGEPRTTTVSRVVEYTTVDTRISTEYNGPYGQVSGYEGEIVDSRFPGVRERYRVSNITYDARTNQISSRFEERWRTGSYTDADGKVHTLDQYFYFTETLTYDERG
ncbi:MAG: hypothetical protein HY351_02445, partial [Candidatus Omnitrophica bacterium]|nr:hypothetical protein [Candidatus Omnitrophota bacterium]